LNAPAVKQVTVKSEIQRGGDSIVDTPLNNEDVLSSVKAISNTLEREQQKNTDTDAFYLGAYFTAFLNTDILLETPGLQNPLALETARRHANLWYKEFRQKQQQLGIDDRTLVSVLHMNYSVVSARLAAWETSQGDAH
jgi:hypothetical protein